MDEELDDDELRKLKFIERGRQLKVGKLIPILQKAGIDADTADSFIPEQWEYWAAQAGCKPPSDTTKERTVAILRTRLDLSRVSS